MQIPKIHIADFFLIDNFCCLHLFVPDKEINKIFIGTTFQLYLFMKFQRSFWSLKQPTKRVSHVLIAYFKEVQIKFLYTVFANKEIFSKLLPLSITKNLPKNQRLKKSYPFIHSLKVQIVEIRGKIPTFPCHFPCNLPDNI